MRNLILAKQQAAKAIGQNFYVTEKWIKRDYDLFGAKFSFKVYSDKKGVYVENREGKIIERPERKTTVSSKRGNATNEKTGKDAE